MSTSTSESVSSFAMAIADALDEIEHERQTVPVPFNLIQDAKLAKDSFPGSVVLLDSGALRHVPLTGGVQSTHEGGVRIKLAPLGSAQGSFHSATTLSATVNKLVLGCLSDSGFEGDASTRVKMGHVAAQGIFVDSAHARLVGVHDTATGNGIIKVCTVTDDGTPKPTALLPVDEAIARASLQWLPWAGRPVVARGTTSTEAQRSKAVKGSGIETILAKTAWCKRFAETHEMSVADAEASWEEFAAASDPATSEAA